MNQDQLHRIQNDRGFIAALDQSGGSTPKALALYGIPETAYNTQEEMFDLVHQMRTRIITSPAFSRERILGAILFKQTVRSQVNGIDTADYLWQHKGIVPFLKIDEGLAEESDDVQLLKPMSELDALLQEARSKNVFGTKMRSLIKAHNEYGIKKVVDQQFEVAKKICAVNLVPIIEPEVDITAANRASIETYLVDTLKNHLDALAPTERVMLKLSIPEQDNLYSTLMSHPNVLRVVALSGGYSRDEANTRLARNNGLIASFSRALSEGLNAQQTDDQFNSTLDATIESIYQASL